MVRYYTIIYNIVENINLLIFTGHYWFYCYEIKFIK